MNAKRFWSKYREHDNVPRPRLRDIFLEWLVNNYLLDSIVLREDYETFRNRAVDWVSERERRIEEKSGRVKSLERQLAELWKEHCKLRDSMMNHYGLDSIEVRAVVHHEIQQFLYTVAVHITEESIVATRYSFGREILPHIFRDLMMKFAGQFKDIVAKLPMSDKDKSEAQLRDEVFDPHVTDLEYFERRRRYHGLG